MSLYKVELYNSYYYTMSMRPSKFSIQFLGNNGVFLCSSDNWILFLWGTCEEKKCHRITDRQVNRKIAVPKQNFLGPDLRR